MEKTFCDSCKEEILGTETVLEFSQKGEHPKRFDLCEPCAERIQCELDSSAKAKQPLAT